MTQSVNYSVEQGVAVLGIDNPPVNALSASVRRGLAEGLERALSNRDVSAIVIIGEGRTFPAGADISEFGKPPEDPWLPELCNRLENATKPVIAALHGTALGGGFEIALSAHYRVAHKSARFGLPEVTLGILPGAGGTQRTPRLAGADLSLDLMLSGKPMRADAPGASVFFDEIIDGDLRQGALKFAEELIASAGEPRRTRDISTGFRDALAYQQSISARRKEVRDAPEIAPREILRCVEAAELLPFEQGLAFERAAFDTCVQSDQSKALRHVFFAERKAAKFPEMAEGQPKEVSRIGIVGGGAIGRGLALAGLAAGFEVVLTERNVARLEKALNQIDSFLDRAMSRGRLSSAMRDRQRTRLQGASDLVALSQADFVIEAGPEDLQGKLTIFAQLDGVVKEGAVLATHTSFLDVGRIAGETGSPADVLGLCFHSPVMSNRLVEVVSGAETGADAVATAVSLIKKLGKVPVRSGGSDGLIGGRLMAACWAAADRMLEGGATPYLIDAAMEDYGMNRGPYKALDAFGLDRFVARKARLAQGDELSGRNVSIADRLCDSGRRGRKSGKGYYKYDTGAMGPVQDPAVIPLIRAERERKGLAARRFEANEIQRRCVAAMVNEAAAMLREGVAGRASDIDTAMVLGFGFPRWRGGPMMAADLKGLLKVRRDLEEFARDEPQFWQPEPVFDELIKNGLGFSSVGD